MLCTRRVRRRSSDFDGPEEKRPSLSAFESHEAVLDGGKKSNPLFDDGASTSSSSSPHKEDAALQAAATSVSSMPPIVEERDERAFRLATLRAAREQSKKQELEQVEEALALLDSLE